MTATDTLAATVSLRTTSVAASVGMEWGGGTLTYNGKQYLFSLQGLEGVGGGYAEVKATGNIYNLAQPSDFEGVYASTEAGAAARGRPATLTLKNPNGVTIALHAVQEGMKLFLAAGGVNIDLIEK